MFLPQVVTAIAGALLGAGLASRFGSKPSTWSGWRPASSRWACSSRARSSPTTRPLAYGLLLVATACLGAGFGLTVPTLNTFTAVFHPAAIDQSVLALNALLGLGTALAPLFVAIFVGLGFGGGFRCCRRSCSPGCSW